MSSGTAPCPLHARWLNPRENAVRQHDCSSHSTDEKTGFGVEKPAQSPAARARRSWDWHLGRPPACHLPKAPAHPNEFFLTTTPVVWGYFMIKATEQTNTCATHRQTQKIIWHSQNAVYGIPFPKGKSTSRGGIFRQPEGATLGVGWFTCAPPNQPEASERH